MLKLIIVNTQNNFNLRILDYNVSKFEGDKSILISNSSFLGGRNRLLGGFFIVFGKNIYYFFYFLI